MKKKITISTKYDIGSQMETQKKQYSQEHYGDTYSQSTGNGECNMSVCTDLPPDVNVFSDLPKKIFDLPEVNCFLAILKKDINNDVFANLTLSKLRVSERTEDSIVLDWAFNYFRVYFSFESNDDSNYGMIENNPIKHIFSTTCKALQHDKYEEIADEVVNFVANKMIE